jgi:2-oxoglutarate dehydrogenase E1 component
MAHRGRLNALANVFHKPLQRIFAEFQENLENESWGNSGDVKYHLGTTISRKVKNNEIRLSILPNPSHLETVNPVVMGHVKAVEDALSNSIKTLGVLIHGDAAVAGQGVVYECLQMGYLPHYQSNGIIHIVANNQIGFTTTPAEARTGLYCTDVAKSIQAPVIHVNADEPELVHKAMQIALDYRQKFHKDIFIDIIGYRRYGHNEQDQPSFTQPMMYQVIGQRKNLYELYAQKLIESKVITSEQVSQMWNGEIKKLKDAYDESLRETFDMKKWKAQNYHRVVSISDLGEIKRTGLSSESLKEVGSAITHIPQDFNIHPQIKKIYDARRQSIETGEGIDFGTAEALAFGSLLQEGFNVRLSGQDVERGTFSHRHAVLVDQKTEEKYMPLKNLIKKGDESRIQIENSLLSEYAVLGFDYGYSITKPTTLTIW